MQHLIEHYFGISPDTSASLLITLFTFIIGYVITAIVFIVSRFNKRRSHRKIFIDNLQNLTKSVQKQEKAFLETIKSLDIIANSPWEYTKADFFQISVFREMSYQESFKSFFLGFENQLSFANKKLKRRAFNRVWENLSNINFWSDQAFNNFYPTLDKFNEHGLKRNYALTELRKMWEQLYSINRANLTTEHLSYIKELDLITSSFQKIPTQKRVNPFTVNRKLILPIKILNRKYIHIPGVMQFNDKASEVGTHYHEMEILLRHTRDQYKIFYYSFRNIAAVNRKIISILK
ncbi:MAG TPA: hypothetical protein PLB49_02690 [Chitinophagaceae bacterium]|nr:hypothetical protein [Chitinophagaceae bacterium]